MTLRRGPTVHCVVSMNGQQVDTLAQMHPTDAEAFRIGEKKLPALWPLTVGKSIEFVSGEPLRPRIHRIAVIGAQSLALPAGRFDTFVVEWTVMDALAGPWGVRSYRYYYDRKSAAVVKFEFQGFHGGLHPVEWEALSIVSPVEPTSAIADGGP